MIDHQILIVDDEPDQLRVLTGHLMDAKNNYNLLIAANGKTALDLATKIKPDLILMDWGLPDMSGVDVIRSLKQQEETKRIPVIMVTGLHNDIDKMQEALEAGAVDFVNKPYNQVELTARIKAQLMSLENFRDFLKRKEQLNELERELKEKEKQILNDKLHFHQKQLTMNTVNLLKTSHLVEHIMKDLNTLLAHTDPEGRKIVKSIISDLGNKSSERLWNEFEYCFEKVHSDFYSKLVEKIPGITLREKRLCSFLFLNMGTKEISSITFQSQNAIDVAKHRLRKKAGLDNESDLVNFIQRL